MMFAYIQKNSRLERLPHDADLTDALWIDLYRPLPEQVTRVADLGVAIPTLADMEEIEISNRLYHEDDTEVMTLVLPGLSTTETPVSGPVTFILSPGRLVTVRHHAPRPFETFPDRANRTTLGCSTHDRVFLGLVEEIVGRLADLLEGIGRSIDDVSGQVFRSADSPDADALMLALRALGREGDLLGRIRLGLMTTERMLSYYGQTLGGRSDGEALKNTVKAEMRDLQALAVHADFLSQRIGLTSDVTLGMVNLQQNATVRIVSVVAALFLPPTLIASIYGMNFASMPELNSALGYPLALAGMVLSAVATWTYFRWKGWL